MVVVRLHDIRPSHEILISFLIVVHRRHRLVLLFLVRHLWEMVEERWVEVKTVQDLVNGRGNVVAEILAIHIHVVKIELGETDQGSMCILVFN